MQNTLQVFKEIAEEDCMLRFKKVQEGSRRFNERYLASVQRGLEGLEGRLLD